MPESPYTYLAPDEVEHAEGVQKLINGLSAWKLEGAYGREMMRMINDGYCLLGHEDTRDYWGNHIPSRTQVQAGTKGSRTYVANLHGEEWADYMAAIPVPESLFA